MRTAAAEATVGDDVYGEDPTVNRLQSRAAEILGTEEALYFPSGTMANQVAALTHATHGEEVIVERRSHIYQWECGGLSATGGLQPKPLDGGEDGLYSSSTLRSNIVEQSLHRAGTGLVCIENTHNHAGGVAHDPSAVGSIASVAHEHDVPVHMDGARLFNAAIATSVHPGELVEPVDTVMCSLSKGLGAPVGSLLAGPAETIETARRYRKRLGGGMRQAGIVAAPALVGLDRWRRVEDDHETATRLADGLRDIEGLAVNEPQTNIVLVDVGSVVEDASAFVEACDRAGVKCVAFGPTRVRFCTHLDVDDRDVETAIARVEDLLSG
jgi:threonine aldolase